VGVPKSLIRADRLSKIHWIDWRGIEGSTGAIAATLCGNLLATDPFGFGTIKFYLGRVCVSSICENHCDAMKRWPLELYHALQFGDRRRTGMFKMLVLGKKGTCWKNKFYMETTRRNRGISRTDQILK